MKDKDDEFDGMSIVNKEGLMIMFPVASRVVGIDFLERDYIQEVLNTGEPYISDPFRALSGNYIVVIAAPVKVNGETVGVFTGSFHLARGIEYLAEKDKRDLRVGKLEGFFTRDRRSTLDRF